jgi:hypothetical protein
MLRRKQRMADELRGKPRVETVINATGTRSQAKNIIIKRTLAKQGRAPFRMFDAEARKLMEDPRFEELRRKYLAGDRGALRTMLDAIGKAMLAIYKDHVHSGKGIKNRQYSDSYFRRKKPGFLMNRTGELLDAFGFEVHLGS